MLILLLLLKKVLKEGRDLKLQYVVLNNILSEVVQTFVPI